jgi:hypothetical protein
MKYLRLKYYPRKRVFENGVVSYGGYKTLRVIRPRFWVFLAIVVSLMIIAMLCCTPIKESLKTEIWRIQDRMDHWAGYWFS